MKMMLRTRPGIAILAVLLLHASFVAAQTRQEIRIPDILGYQTLKCDFHMHTIFSDGLVWPTVRVEEAWREGLDAIAITDHIEYQPHKDDVPTNLNRSYDIALPRAKERGVLLVHAAEFTRETPPGHFNALFIDDAKPLDTKELLDGMAEAMKQGAFIWWNHPGWQPEHKGWFDFHTTILEKKYLKGIEVVNGETYYPEAHQWALEKNLAFLGNSDIHDAMPIQKTTPELHRPMTFLFVKERSISGLKEALLAGRTAVWYGDKVIARQEYLDALFGAAVRIPDVQYEKKVVRFALHNSSDLLVRLVRAGKMGPRGLTLPANSTVRVRVDAENVEKPIELAYVVSNFLVAPDKGLPVSLIVAGQPVADIKAESK